MVTPKLIKQLVLNLNEQQKILFILKTLDLSRKYL